MPETNEIEDTTRVELARVEVQLSNELQRQISSQPLAEMSDVKPTVFDYISSREDPELLEQLNKVKAWREWRLERCKKAANGKGKAPTIEENIPSLDLEALERINEVNFQVAIERLLVDVHQRPGNNRELADVTNEPVVINTSVHDLVIAKKLHAVDRDDLVDIHVEHEKDDGKEEDVNLVLDEGNLVEIVVDQDEDLHKSDEVVVDDNDQNLEEEDEGISAKNDNVFIEEVVEDETHVGKESDMEEVVEEKREEIAEENRVDLQEEIEATVGREHLTNIDINLKKYTTLMKEVLDKVSMMMIYN
nr:CTTNBP2 N-terminal-like protein [Ipomoea batatas]